jgi:predicted nucleotidyltransferase
LWYILGRERPKDSRIEEMQPDGTHIDELIQRIVAVTRPSRILLFGSGARGEMGPHSDLDVLVVVSEGTPRRATAQRIYRNMIGFPVAVDVVVATESDLLKYGDNYSLVFYPALREGREVYAA